MSLAVPPVRSRPAADNASPVAPSTGQASLAAQRALLEEARAALGRGDSQAALQAVETHAQRYPNSVLLEEREALAIKALASAGRYAEAKTRAARFRTRYPQSIMLPAIDEVLGTIP